MSLIKKSVGFMLDCVRSFRLVMADRRIRKTAQYVGKRFINNSLDSCVTPYTVIGDDVNFNGMQIIGSGMVRIGNYFHSGKDCKIISDNHDYDEGRCLPYDDVRVKCKPVIIEDNVWLGTNVIILGGGYIHEGAIIQSGSVVVGDIPACSIAGGHPAKVFKYRDIKHYEELKDKKAFLINKLPKWRKNGCLNGIHRKRKK